MYTDEQLEILRGASIAAISDALDTLSRKQWVFNPSVRLVVGSRIFGRAIPIMVAVTGEKAHHKVGNQCLDESPAGSVLIAAGEPDHCALYGAPEIETATRRQLGGLVTDCAVRTTHLETTAPVGVAATGVSASSAFGRVKTMALTNSVECAGVKVSKDDVISGDASGVVVVPVNLVAEVAGIVLRMDERIRTLVQTVRDGGELRSAIDKHWVIQG